MPPRQFVPIDDPPKVRRAYSFVRITLAVACVVAMSSPAMADCFDDAAAYQHVNPLILRAIAWQESHNRPDAVHQNANGSVDYGLMQINTIHLPALSRYGISREALMSPCKSIYIAAWHLRRQMLKYGNSWAAVGAYHSATPGLRDDYARRIAGILQRWRVMSRDTAKPATSYADRHDSSVAATASLDSRSSPHIDTSTELR